MNKSEYMSELKQALSELDEETRKEMLEDYEEHFQIGLAEGKSEEAIINELGEISELVKELKHMDLSQPGKTAQNQSFEERKPETCISHELESNIKSDELKENSSQNTDGNEERPVRKLILRSKFANVELTKSQSDRLSLEHRNYGNERQQQCYEFRTWQEGDTVYGEVVRDSIGLLGFMNTPNMVILAGIPDSFDEVEVRAMSGDTKARDLLCNALNIYSASGDIDTVKCSAGQINLDTKSGEISATYMKSACCTCNSASGDVQITDCEAERLTARTLSGDMEVRGFHGNVLEAQSTSGDTKVSEINCGQVMASSISGDVNVSNTQGNMFKGSSKSGDISIEICMNEADVNSISGDVQVVNAKDLTLRASSVSGDVDIRLSKSSGYTAVTKTVSGEAILSFHNGQNCTGKSGNYSFGEGTSKITASTTSGDIQIQA